MARFNFLCVALFIYIVYKTCSKRRQGIYGIYSGIAGRQRYYRPGREGIENPAGGWKGKRISVWSGSGRKSFIESAGTGMYPCALICKICSFEKLTRNCVAASKLQNPMRLSARVATPEVRALGFNRFVLLVTRARVCIRSDKLRGQIIL